MGAVGTAADNAMMESFWGRMQVELLDRRRCKTRIELASAIHDYIELWHNTRRRHSALGMLTPSEVEAAWAATETDAVAQAGFAKTAPTAVVDQAVSSGLSDLKAKAVHADHQHLLLNNNQAA
jgi:Integrase core domain